jgi:hypothetical protein
MLGGGGVWALRVGEDARRRSECTGMQLMVSWEGRGKAAGMAVHNTAMGAADWR